MQFLYYINMHSYNHIQPVLAAEDKARVRRR
jgi:hypothetical protein